MTKRKLEPFYVWLIGMALVAGAAYLLAALNAKSCARSRAWSHPGPLFVRRYHGAL